MRDPLGGPFVSSLGCKNAIRKAQNSASHHVRKHHLYLGLTPDRSRSRKHEPRIGIAGIHVETRARPARTDEKQSLVVFLLFDLVDG